MITYYNTIYSNIIILNHKTVFIICNIVLYIWWSPFIPIVPFSLFIILTLGGWWLIKEFNEISGNIAMEVKNACYIESLDNGLFKVAGEHSKGKYHLIIAVQLL